MSRNEYEKDSQRGFTLLEIVIVAAIVTVLFNCFIMFFLIGFRLWEGGDIRVELQQEMRNAMEQIANDLRQAGRSSIINFPADGSERSAITFRVGNGVSNGRISWSNTPISYGINANQLLRREGDANIIIAENIQSLQFRRQSNAPDIVEVALGVAKSSMRATLNDSLNFKVKLRN